MRRCFRCSGRKKVYKMGSGYSLVDCGGVQVDCPLCLGKGQIESREKIQEIFENKKIEEETFSETHNKSTKEIPDEVIMLNTKPNEPSKEIELKKDKTKTQTKKFKHKK